MWREDVLNGTLQSTFVNMENLSKKDLLLELVMLSLRTSKGLNLHDFEKQSGKSLIELNTTLFQGLQKENLIKINNGYLRFTVNGFLVSTSILNAFFELIEEKIFSI